MADLVETGSWTFVRSCGRMMSAAWINQQIAETSTVHPDAAVGLTGLGAADEHGGDGSGGRRAQDQKFILWHYICSGDHAPTKNQ